MDSKIKILHVISGLSAGGAEAMLYKLLTHIDRSSFSSSVVSLTSRGFYADKIESIGVSVDSLSLRRGIPDPRSFFLLRSLVIKHRPDVVQTWMYHSDLIGGIASKLVGNIPVVWNIRHSNLALGENKRMTLWAANACAFASKYLPRSIVCCSEASKRVHEALGYDSNKMLVISNGFNLDAFCSDYDIRVSVRHELGVKPDELLIGLIARFDPQKNHENFIKSAALINDSGYKCKYLLCGSAVDSNNPSLHEWIKTAGLSDQFLLLGERQDISRIMASLDIATLSSSSEGFPNVLGEAMACEVPCVATDVGDAAEIIGDTGYVVPPRNSFALAEALKKMSELGHEGRMALGKKARLRVQENYELSFVVKKYEDLYREVLA